MFRGLDQASLPKAGKQHTNSIKRKQEAMHLGDFRVKTPERKLFLGKKQENKRTRKQENKNTRKLEN